MLVSAFCRRSGRTCRCRETSSSSSSPTRRRGDLGARFLAEEHPELFEGMRYALGEFGGFTLHLGGKRFSRSRWRRSRLLAEGDRARPRRPRRDGAPRRHGRAAGKLLRDLDRKRLPVRVTPVVREFVERIAAELPRKEAVVLRSLLKPRLTDSALRLLGERGDVAEPMLRNTVNATIIRGGAKINVVPSEIELELDGRALRRSRPADRGAAVARRRRRRARARPPRSGPSAPDLGLFETLAGVIRSSIRREFRCRCSRSASPTGASSPGRRADVRLPADAAPRGLQYAKLIHAADERIPVKALEFGAEAVWRAIQRFG